MIDSLRKRIRVARREIPADLVLKGGKVINVFSGEIRKQDVAISEGVIAGVGPEYKGLTEEHVENCYLAPGFMDAHLHIESSMLTPSHLAPSLLIKGTTTIVSDPHEIANVKGLEGIRFMLKDSRSIPFDIFFTAPSCVPATPLETSGATLTATDLRSLLEEPRVLGLAEVMNFPGVLQGEEEVLKKILLFQRKNIDGHCPNLEGYDLQAYLSAGIRSEHEATSMAEGREKLENGMMLLIREGTNEKNLEQLLPLVNPITSSRVCFVCDDLHAEDIEKRGHLDFVLRKAVGLGLDPVTAVRAVTLNPAQYFGLNDRGAVAPGYRADLVVLEDINSFHVTAVYKDGKRVVHDRALVDFSWERAGGGPGGGGVPLNTGPLTKEHLRIPHPGGKARIILLVPGQIITGSSVEGVGARDGFVVPDLEKDILSLVVVERHKATGRVGLGLVRGFCLKQGALASSVAHDSHNIISVGVGEEEILRAVLEVRDMGGGLAVVRGDQTLAKMPLEVGGLMSSRPLGEVVKSLRELKKAATILGCIPEEPFMALSFLALPVIPELKLTDQGLVDVNRFMHVPLFCGNMW